MGSNVINVNTKLAAIFKQHPDALEAIISISHKFSKLRNPLLRKVMASRTSINAASKVSGCSVDDFFRKLEPLGFVIDSSVAPKTEEKEQANAPSFIKNISGGAIEELDVRPIIDSGKDPFSIIMEKIRQLSKTNTLKLVNSFEPLPLIQVLSKKGYAYYVEHISADEVHTYFHKTDDVATTAQTQPDVTPDGDWEIKLQQYNGNMITVDVRHLEMPLPMLTILDELEKLPGGKALYVYHKRIPVFLLPELQERGFEYRIKEINASEVHLLVYRTK